MLYLASIQDILNGWIAHFVGLPWYIHMALGAASTLLIIVLMKWMAHKLKGLVLALKIISVIALVAGILIYFIIK